MSRFRIGLVVALVLFCADGANAQHLYYSAEVPEGVSNSISRADLDGANPQVVLTHQEVEAWGATVGIAISSAKFYGLTIDLVLGKMYWGTKNSAQEGYILRANLDGSNIEAVLEPPLAHNIDSAQWALVVYRPSVSVPAVSTWGLAVLGLLVLTVGSVLIGRRRVGV